MRFEMIPIEKLVPDMEHEHDHAKTAPYLVKSIEEFGFIEPLLINSGFSIIAGNAKYKAAKELGLTELPCVILDGEDIDTDKYKMVANKIAAKSRYDNSYVARMIERIPELVQYGFRVANRKPQTEVPALYCKGVTKQRGCYRCNNFFYISFLRAQEKLDLAELKHKPEFAEYVIAKMVDYINTVFGNKSDICIVYAPKRRTTTGNVAEKIAEGVAERTGIKVYRDAFVSHNRNRYYPDFELVTDIPEKEIILLDDILTSGATVINCVKLLEQKNIHVLIGLTNQHT